MQIWDDVVTESPSPEAMKAIRERFDELVATGKIEVLTVRISSGTVTFIRAGSARNDLEDI